ncbi:MAG TPA: LPXTG cell wall anchor domain-containing protein [Methanobacterium sp.]|nr:LPXTG cell wall anchor domain-containing protein [Methanobacterium sp.]
MIQSVTVTTATITTEQALGLFIGIIIVLLIITGLVLRYKREKQRI